MGHRFTELVDKAQEEELRTTEAAIERVRSKAAPETHPDFDGQHCVEPDCGDLIPMKRRMLGKVRCVICQEILEKKGKKS